MKTNPCQHCQGTGKEPDQNTIGSTLVKLRKSAKVKQKDIAAFLDMAPSYLCEIESGKKGCTLVQYRRYVQAVKNLKQNKQ